MDRTNATAIAALAVAGFATISWLKCSRAPRIKDSVEVKGCGKVAVTSTREKAFAKVTLDWAKIFGKLPPSMAKIPFCSLTVADDGTIHVSGTVGIAPPSSPDAGPVLVEGGAKAETYRILELMEGFLASVGATMADVTMVHCYLADYSVANFAEMNAGYLEYFGKKPLPARITVGCTGLAMGAKVEIDLTAKI
mmetsp:Transcript_35849/g.76487  ORF Transcript_35849/g.76487 Transcript_35849/m.76487 type:complete len:194 (+) Transcript_35849:177-758(+)